MTGEFTAERTNNTENVSIWWRHHKLIYRLWNYEVNMHNLMSAMASPINSPTIAYSTVSSGADQRKHQSSASLAFVRGIHRWPVNSPHKGPVTRKMFPFADVIMTFTTWEPISRQRMQFYWQQQECKIHWNEEFFIKYIRSLLLNNKCLYNALQRTCFLKTFTRKLRNLNQTSCN